MPLPTKPWRPEFGPLPAALAHRIPVDPTLAEVRAAANAYYIDEVAAIEAEPDPDIARERARRLDETLNDALPRARLARLSPAAGRLMRAMEGIHGEAVIELRSGQGVAVFGDVAFDSRRRA